MPSKIIKGSALAVSSLPCPQAEAPGKVIEREVFLAHEKARQIVEQAELQARQILAQAEANADETRQEARLLGYQEGFAQWEELVVLVAEKSRRMAERLRPRLLRLSVRIAEKILRRRLEEDPEAMQAMWQEALEAAHAHGCGGLSLRVHPDDLETLHRMREQLRRGDPRWEVLEVVAEEEVPRGGCRIDTDFGTVDASVDTQLAIIEQILMRGAS